MNARDFYATVAERAALSKEEAADLTRATLELLAARLSNGAAVDLAVHAPEPLDEVIRTGAKATESFDFEDFVDRLNKRTGLNVQETTRGVRAVLGTFHERIPTEVYDRAMSQLPKDFRTLAGAVT